MVSGINRGEKLSAIKLTVVQYGILLLMLALVAGLWRLQVLDVQNYRVLAQQNRIRKEPILAPRGKLFDRNDRIIVDDYPSVTCFLVREQSKTVEADLPLIAKGLDLNVDDLRATLHRYRAQPGYQPIPIKEDVTADEQAFIAAHRNELPELETIDVERRLYPRDGFAAHLIGYVGEVSEEDLNNPRFAYYEPGDVVGKAGVEETYDELLRGQDGSREVIVDSHGREVGYFGIQHAIPGQDSAADHRQRSATCRRACTGRPQRRHRRDGPAQWRDSGHGLAAQLRSQRFCGEDQPRRVEQAGNGP